MSASHQRCPIDPLACLRHSKVCGCRLWGFLCMERRVFVDTIDK